MTQTRIRVALAFGQIILNQQCSIRTGCSGIGFTPSENTQPKLPIITNLGTLTTNRNLWQFFFGSNEHQHILVYLAVMLKVLKTTAMRSCGFLLFIIASQSRVVAFNKLGLRWFWHEVSRWRTASISIVGLWPTTDHAQLSTRMGRIWHLVLSSSTNIQYSVHHKKD